MKHLLKLMISTIIFIPLLGCWDRQEINDIAIVTGSSFDMVGENEYKIATQVPLPGEMGGVGSAGGGGGTSGGSLFYLDAGIGNNVREANADTQQRMSRQLIFGHRRIAIFGEALAQSGIRRTLDVLTRTREARLSTRIFVAEGEAINVLAAKPQLENLSAESIREIGAQKFDITLRDFLLDFQQKGNDPLLPVLTLVKNESPDPEMVEDQIEINKVAVFKGDKLEFITNEKQTSAIKWILAEKPGEVYPVMWEETQAIVARISEQSSDVSYRIENGKPVMVVNVEFTGNIIENETDLNFEERGAFDKVNKKMEEEIKVEIESILEETFSKGIDSFGLGWLLHRRERNKWNNEWKDNWREMLIDIDYDIQVNSALEYTGLVTEGIGIGE
ncbi:Ger(x)C family spore germination protein [Alkalihalobacillus sp. MEB130]|uniref:Ger(x)C family spore germination protein n=1 Tax=Alkalihalobacillus sp. MEB130 TaxID=2976704 RepID=UPI0028E03138|nr:Ger(x)C family spore germination protein [Alkalihalobacillus sp. MEB130]MDT8861187.1 Ger(x)C family spore germination protein [Alkalihalobacillus sp. MEB130]